MSHPDVPFLLQRLREGNARFVAGEAGAPARLSAARREELVKGQTPFAVVLGCADSRVPVEHIFDQGPGDLFVVRVAGNVAAPAALGSIEYAVGVLGCRLLVVLGHSGCGAVQATLDHLDDLSGPLSPALASIVDRIAGAVGPLEAEGGDDLLPRCVEQNVRSAVAELGRELPKGPADSVHPRGAVYDLATGKVEFLDE